MKSIRFVFAIVFALTLTLRPVKSEAAIGAIVAAPAAVTVGLCIAGTGVGIAVADIAIGLLSDPEIHYPTGIFTAIFAVPLLGLGLIVLEEKQGAVYSAIAPWSVEGAEKLGLTPSEIDSFNSEIDQVNALAAHVDSEMAARGSKDPQVASQIWLEVKDAVAPETFSAMVKVTAGLTQK